MKAAVLHEFGKAPKYENCEDPIASPEQELITVKTASVKNLDKLRASGTHYASYTHLPVIVGIDGVGVLEDGTRVYAHGLHGTIAEKAVIRKGSGVKLPAGIDDVTAAALPNAVMGAAMALCYRAKVNKGDVVIINGATGVTGQIAVQVAKHFGASQIIATGRNPEILEQLKALGATKVISLKQDAKVVVEELKELHKATPVNVVIDYLWGQPVEVIMAAFKTSGMMAFSSVVRLVTVGSMAGEDIKLSSGTLRSSGIELLGSGLGSFTKEDINDYNTRMLPEMFSMAADGELTIQTETAPLSDIEQAWQKKVEPGKRLVITM